MARLREINYTASVELFGTGDPLLYIPAATLGHHALEMYLKAALILRGYDGLQSGNPQIPGRRFCTHKVGLRLGHCLVDLARLLSEKRADFALRAEINLPECLVVPMPMTLVAGFALASAITQNRPLIIT